jgi:hypothetical protein
MNRPETNEYAPYYEKYISLIEPDTLMQRLETQAAELRALFDGLGEERGLHRYEPGKWTLKESLVHVIDAERMFAYRVLRISRGDATPIEGFEQDNYIEHSNANNRSFSDLLDDFELTRRSNLHLIRNIDDVASRRAGTASGNPVSVRALIYIMAGHIDHHLPIFRDKYLA